MTREWKLASYSSSLGKAKTGLRRYSVVTLVGRRPRLQDPGAGFYSSPDKMNSTTISRSYVCRMTNSSHEDPSHRAAELGKCKATRKILMLAVSVLAGD